MPVDKPTNNSGKAQARNCLYTQSISPDFNYNNSMQTKNKTIHFLASSNVQYTYLHLTPFDEINTIFLSRYHFPFTL